MIIVTGATGQLGRGIVERLVARVPTPQVGVSVRDPAKAADLAALGVRVRRGDFEDAGSLAHAFEGASQILMVSSNARASGGDALAQHRTAIDVAHAAGARRIVYTSQMAASPSSKFPPMRDHVATEAMLAASGLAWTALRHGFYASSGLMFMGEAPRTGLLEVPQDGPVAWTAHADLAEAAAAVLADEGSFDGPTPPLTGSQALDLTALAAIASDILGRPVERRVLADEVMAARVPAHVAGIVMGFYAAARDGEWARVDPTLERLIGHPPTSMRDVMAAALAG